MNQHPNPEVVRTRKEWAPIPPEGAIVQILAFLPKSLVERIQETGRPMSQYIRGIIEEKFRQKSRSGSREKNPPISC